MAIFVGLCELNLNDMSNNYGCGKHLEISVIQPSFLQMKLPPYFQNRLGDD